MTLRKLNMIVVGVVVGVTGAFAAALFVPGTKALRQRREELAQRVTAVQEEQRQIGNIGELYAAIVEMDRKTQDFRTRLPAERQFGEFLKAVSDRLKEVGIEQSEVQQQAEQRLEDSKVPAELKLAKGTGILPVQVNFDSSFAELFDFLKSMEALPRLSHVESLLVKNDEARPGRVHAEIVLHTYYRPDGGTKLQ